MPKMHFKDENVETNLSACGIPTPNMILKESEVTCKNCLRVIHQNGYKHKVHLINKKIYVKDKMFFVTSCGNYSNYFYMNGTENKEEVNCKLCLKMMERGAQ